MRIACSRCQTNYDVPDEKLTRGAVKVRCSKCGHTFAVRTRSASEESEGPLAGPGGSAPAPGSAAPKSPPAARFEDFDFGSFDTPPEPVAEEGGAAGSLEGLLGNAAPAPPTPPRRDFPAVDDSSDLRGEPVAARGPAAEERVPEEDVVSPRAREAPARQGTDGAPRLDIQRGPRMPEREARPSPVMARDRRRSPLQWAVVLVGAVVLAYTGYNVYFHREEAFRYFNLERIRSLWQSREVEARLGIEGLTGYYPDLPSGRRAFVIRGEVVNRSNAPQSLIRVQASLYAADGTTLATREVYSGNVISEEELATLAVRVIEGRLQNEVGDAMTNIEVQPGGRVPFTVAFLPAPDGVEKFSAKAVHAKSGAVK